MQRSVSRVQEYFWYLMIAALPVTSMPLVSRLLGSDSVASPAIVFLFLFTAAWFASGFFKRIKINRNIFGLVLFSLAAIFASLISLFYVLPLFKEQSYIRPMIASIATLAIGVLFFAAASSFPDNSDIREKTFRIINFSGLAILSWCLIQAISWYLNNGYPEWMFNFQGLLSQRVLYRQRVTGFTLEPSWLAHQLNLFYLPFWLASTLTRSSSHRFRLFGLSVENLLLAGGVFSLGLTLSRVGFAAFFMALLVAFVYLHAHMVSGIRNWISKRFPGKKPIRALWISSFILAVYVLLVISVVLTYSRVDPRMANLLSFDFSGDNSLLRYFNELKFGDRVIYWLAGWNIFNDHPVLGVGLGNAGFFFPEKIPSFGWSLVEVRALMYRSTLLLNIKNLWVRLLAETGIVGFSLFVGWLLSLIPEFVNKFKSGNQTMKMLALMGFMVLAAMLFEGFSIDSFAMPYWWVSLGLAAASYKA